MKPRASKSAIVLIVFLLVFVGASCTSHTKSTDEVRISGNGESTGEGTRTVAIRPGEAGGVIQDTFTTSATVKSIDASTRRITLTASDGASATIKAGPEVRNFDQIHVGDTVTATVVETLYVFVRDGHDPASVTHAAAPATAPKGAKPGALVAEAYEITAKVKSIDSANRKATIEFIDGSTKTVNARPDVDLSRYKAGDTVVIQISQVLSVLVSKS